MEGASHGIRAISNTISTGLIVTSATKPTLHGVPGLHKPVTHKLMIKRLGQPADIGWCATFLASNESSSSWITAADFRVHGGATAWEMCLHPSVASRPTFRRLPLMSSYVR